MSKFRKFIIKNYMGFGHVKFPWLQQNNVTKEYSLGWMYGSYTKGTPKVFLTFLLYGILKLFFGSIYDFNWYWELPLLLSAFLQLYWFTPFYGLSYFEKHPLTNEERKELLNE